MRLSHAAWCPNQKSSHPRKLPVRDYQCFASWRSIGYNGPTVLCTPYRVAPIPSGCTPWVKIVEIGKKHKIIRAKSAHIPLLGNVCCGQDWHLHPRSREPRTRRRESYLCDDTYRGDFLEVFADKDDFLGTFEHPKDGPGCRIIVE